MVLFGGAIFMNSKKKQNETNLPRKKYVLDDYLVNILLEK